MFNIPFNFRLCASRIWTTDINQPPAIPIPVPMQSLDIFPQYRPTRPEIYERGRRRELPVIRWKYNEICVLHPKPSSQFWQTGKLLNQSIAHILMSKFLAENVCPKEAHAITRTRSQMVLDSGQRRCFLWINWMVIGQFKARHSILKIMYQPQERWPSSYTRKFYLQTKCPWTRVLKRLDGIQSIT